MHLRIGPSIDALALLDVVTPAGITALDTSGPDAENWEESEGFEEEVTGEIVDCVEVVAAKLSDLL